MQEVMNTVRKIVEDKQIKETVSLKVIVEYVGLKVTAPVILGARNCQLHVPDFSRAENLEGEWAV